MKHIFGILSLTFIFLCTLSAASGVTWEGRAVVGTASLYPASGMYGLSRVFSVGEIVEIYNPLNERRVSVVISDRSDTAGILIVLSPQAAAALALDGTSDSIVRVSKIPEYAFEPNSINSRDMLPPEPVQKLEDENKIPRTDPPITVEEYALNVPANTETPESTSLAETVPEPPVPEGEPAEIPPARLAEDSSTEIKNEPISVISEVALVESPEALNPEKNSTEMELEAAEYDLPLAAEIVTGNKPVITAETPSSELEPETETIGVADSENTTEIITYTLIETAPNPPKAGNETEKKSPALEPEKKLSVSSDVKPITEIIEAQELKSGSYYVQIAFLMEKNSAHRLKNEQEKNYPVVINPANNGYQLLVGPLTSSEYSAVLARLKKSGYKDAFVRKIN